MRTETIVKKLGRMRNWLKVWLISRKQVLNSKEAAIYLKTTLRYLYQLTGDHHLPVHRTKKHLLYFKRKEIDQWLHSRGRDDLPKIACKRKRKKIDY